MRGESRCRCSSYKRRVEEAETFLSVLRFMSAPTCWICGATADSAEHMVKASDFRSVFGRVTQSSPAYRQSKEYPNQPIRGAKAELLKFAPSLCGHCNSTLTQPHDRAWQTLSESVRCARPAIAAGNRIPLQRIFPGTVRESMLGVHFYFLKLLGCHAVEHKIPLPVNQFAICLQASVPIQALRLVFVNVPAGSSHHKIQVGDIKTLNIGGKTVSAVWFYRIETLGVVVSYCEPGHPRLTRDRGWHPNDVCARIVMS